MAPVDDNHLPVVTHLDPVIMNIDYYDLKQVIVLAKRLSLVDSPMRVVKYPHWDNYNIVRQSDEYQLPPNTKVVWRSED